MSACLHVRLGSQWFWRGELARAIESEYYIEVSGEPPKPLVVFAVAIMVTSVVAFAGAITVTITVVITMAITAVITMAITVVITMARWWSLR